MRRAVIILAVMLASASAGAQRAQQPAVEVFKSPTCGCCSKWVDHLRAHGFTVHTTDVEAIDEVKAKHQIPQSARSSLRGQGSRGARRARVGAAGGSQRVGSAR